MGAAGTSFRTDGAASPIAEADGGFPLLQTGGALAAAGSAWLAGSLLLDREWWWLTLALGAALGSAAGGLLVLAD